ncbi:MAG: phage tail sheath C-terminal domain-containing protein [Ginsengibacter sp.]
MPEYTAPGIYIEETPDLATSVNSVATAIPAFAGYTEKAQLNEPGDLLNKAFRITSIAEYEIHFGFADPEKGLEITFENIQNSLTVIGTVNDKKRSHYLLYYSLQLFFLNGGGPCYIISVGSYLEKGIIKITDLKRGLRIAGKVDEVTLLLFPDAINLKSYKNYYSLYKQAMKQAAELKDRFTILTVFHQSGNTSAWKKDVALLRKSFDSDTSYLQYGAAYFPRLYTNIRFNTQHGLVNIVSNNAGDMPSTLAELESTNEAFYNLALEAIGNIEMRLPASPAVAGVYAHVDAERGVWKAPANINIDAAIRPEYVLTLQEQEELNNGDSEGKYINVIRTFAGKGPAIIWGARTLAGNDNEWRYISVRRYFNMVGESCKDATESFVFEPNNTNTWTHVRSLIENYLIQQWSAGALMGTKPDDGFYVRVGLGSTMTQADIDAGIMNVEIGMAVIRPAEFVILRFSHKMVNDDDDD